MHVKADVYMEPRLNKEVGYYQNPLITRQFSWSKCPRYKEVQSIVLYMYVHDNNLFLYAEIISIFLTTSHPLEE